MSEKTPEFRNLWDLNSFAAANPEYHRAMHILIQDGVLGTATEGLSRSLRAAARLHKNPLGLDLENPKLDVPEFKQDVETARAHIAKVLSNNKLDSVCEWELDETCEATQASDARDLSASEGGEDCIVKPTWEAEPAVDVEDCLVPTQEEVQA